MSKEDYARALLAADAFKINIDQPFKLVSGLWSPFYVDCRLVIGNVEARNTLADGLAKLAAPLLNEVDVIAGGVTAGVPIATLLADRTNKPLCYVRPEPKAHGIGRQIEGAEVSGKRVLLVEDVLVRGTSITKFKAALGSAGAQYQNLMVILTRAAPEVLSDLEAQHIKLHALLTLDDLLRVIDMDYSTRAEIDRFQKDPQAWSAARS